MLIAAYGSSPPEKISHISIPSHHNYNRLLANHTACSEIGYWHHNAVCPYVRPIICPSVTLCIVALRVCERIKSCTVVFLAGNFLITSSDTFAVACWMLIWLQNYAKTNRRNYFIASNTAASRKHKRHIVPPVPQCMSRKYFRCQHFCCLQMM